MSSSFEGQKIKNSSMESCIKLPTQDNYLGDWTEAFMLQILNDSSEICGVQFLNKIVDALFPAKELTGICNKRLSSYDQDGKRLGAQGDPRLSIYVGNSSAISKSLCNGDKHKFEEDLVEFFSALFTTQEKEVVQKSLKSEKIKHVVIINSF